MQTHQHASNHRVRIRADTRVPYFELHVDRRKISNSLRHVDALNSADVVCSIKSRLSRAPKSSGDHVAPDRH